MDCEVGSAKLVMQGAPEVQKMSTDSFTAVPGERVSGPDGPSCSHASEPRPPQAQSSPVQISNFSVWGGAWDPEQGVTE